MRKNPVLLSGAAIILAFAVSVGHAQAVLTIVDSEVVTKFPMRGVRVEIAFTVKNIGEEQAPERSSLAVNVLSTDEQGNHVAGDFVQAILRNARNIIRLNPNQTQRIRAFATLDKHGHHTAVAAIYSDPAAGDKILVENGTRRHHFMLVPPADLVLERAQFNHQGRLMLQMYNGGGRILDKYFERSEIEVNTGGRAYKMMLKDAVPRAFQNAVLGWMLGGARRYTFIWPTSGPHGIALNPRVKQKVEVILDHNYEINDSNRANNGIKQEIGGKPDLVVCFRKRIHNKPHRNATYSPIVKNIGFATSRESYLRFWIADKGWKLYRIRALAPGTERKINRGVYWFRVKDHRFRLTADFEQKVDEMFEDNNKIEGIVTVGAYGIKTDVRCSDSPGMTGFN